VNSRRKHPVAAIGGDLIKQLISGESHTSSEVGGASNRGGEIFQYLLSNIERLHSKVERVVKIKTLFSSQSNRLAQTVLEHVRLAQERTTLLSHSVDSAGNRVEAVLKVV
jgi:hypothetical protein